jgi:glycosyltransferase involved in cell wall biosynthesis
MVQRAVRSALNQTFHDLEVVVVIDGPDAATETALAGMGDVRLRVVSLSAHVGAAEARNIGIHAAQGRWVALLDDDDEWLPSKIEKQIAAALASAATQPLITCRYLCRSVERTDSIRPRRLPHSGESIAEYMFDFLCYFQTSTFFGSRELFVQTRFQKQLTSLQDVDWFFRANLNSGVCLVVVAEALSIYNIRQDELTITTQAGWRERLTWGRNNRHLMTGRAYSRFISGSCIGRAVQDKAGLLVYLRLLRECFAGGFPEFSSFMVWLGTCLVTPSLRRRIRDSIFLGRAKSIGDLPVHPPAECVAANSATNS